MFCDNQLKTVYSFLQPNRDFCHWKMQIVDMLFCLRTRLRVDSAYLFHYVNIMVAGFQTYILVSKFDRADSHLVYSILFYTLHFLSNLVVYS